MNGGWATDEFVESLLKNIDLHMKGTTEGKWNIKIQKDLPIPAVTAISREKEVTLFSRELFQDNPSNGEYFSNVMFACYAHDQMTVISETIKVLQEERNNWKEQSLKYSDLIWPDGVEA